MASYYEVPGGIAWCKANLHVIIGNKSLDDILNYGDLWRERGHKPAGACHLPRHGRRQNVGSA